MRVAGKQSRLARENAHLAQVIRNIHLERVPKLWQKLQGREHAYSKHRVARLM